MIDFDAMMERRDLVRWIHEQSGGLCVMRCELDAMPTGEQRQRLEHVYGRLVDVLVMMRAASPEFAAQLAGLQALVGAGD